MSALSLTLKVDNISPSLEALADPALKRKMLLAAGTLVESYAVRAFDEAGVRPTPWPARKNSKAAHPLLIKSGNMRQSIHTQVQGNDSVQVGASVPYAAAQQLGSTKKNIPPRPFFPVLENQLTGQVDEELVDILSGIVQRAGQV